MSAASAVTAPEDPRLLGRDVKRIAYTEAELRVRVAELGAEITAAYGADAQGAAGGAASELLVLGLLKGSFVFLADLVRQIQLPLHVDFLVASSYGGAMVTSGDVKLVYDPETTLEGKHIILVEDIVDSGKTLATLVSLLQGRAPRSIEICALLHKRIATELTYPVKYVGFDAPNEFLVGYGLDHAENFRHLPYVASLR